MIAASPVVEPGLYARIVQDLHGILAPAATELGETLALFEDQLPESELPAILAEARWDMLPVDPRSEAQRLKQLALRT